MNPVLACWNFLLFEVGVFRVLFCIQPTEHPFFYVLIIVQFPSVLVGLHAIDEYFALQFVQYYCIMNSHCFFVPIVAVDPIPCFWPECANRCENSQSLNLVNSLC